MNITHSFYIFMISKHEDLIIIYDMIYYYY